MMKREIEKKEQDGCSSWLAGWLTFSCSGSGRGNGSQFVFNLLEFKLRQLKI